MEKIVVIESVGAFRKVEVANSANGPLKLREFVFRSGNDKFTGAMFGNLAEKNENTQYSSGYYVVEGNWQLRTSEYDGKDGQKHTMVRNEFRINNLTEL